MTRLGATQATWNVEMWNVLPLSVRQLSSISCFKKEVREVGSMCTYVLGNSHC